MLRWPLLLLASCLAQGALAQVRVVSARPDAVTLTVYRQGIAQVTETRQLELPAGPVMLVFQGVVDALLPQSAVINGAGRPILENNFDFDGLSPASLLERSIGRAVSIVRTNRRTGALLRQAATIVSASARGVVIRTADGNEAFHCSGLAERLEFSEIPAELHSSPTLSIRLPEGAAGKRSVTLSYLVHGLTWNADYVARLNAAANRMDLSGWVTLTNETSASFNQAQVQLVSGELQLIPDYEDGSGPLRSRFDPDEESEAEPAMPLNNCFPQPSPVEQADEGANELDVDDEYELSEVMVTGTRIQRESLGDYKLYRLPEPTDLKSRQTKQALFIHKPRVKVERYYQLLSRDFSPDEGDREEVAPPRLGLQWRNDRSAGLGDPLPGGVVRIFEAFRGDVIFAGAGKISDKPIGLPVEVLYADAMGVDVESTRELSAEYPFPDEKTISVQVRHRLINDKAVPVVMAIRHRTDWPAGTPRVRNSSVRPVTADGAPEWRIRIPARSQRVLDYKLEADNLRYGD